MANLRDIRRRITSVKKTAQVTRAMQLVAAAKMKKAQTQALAGRGYADKLNQVLTNLKGNVDEESHALLEKREGKKTLTLVISTDKGLCGGLNANLTKAVIADKTEDNDYVTVGKKLHIFLAKTNNEILAKFDVNDPVIFAQARPIAKYLCDKFLAGDYDVIKVAFTNFVSTMVQTPHVSQLLPIEASKLAEKRGYEGVGKDVIGETDKQVANTPEYKFEPSPETVLDSLLPLYINFQIYQMIVEARASEHSARMVSMKGATDNANNMIDDLTLDYNKLRQAAITSELLEITTAMKAME